MSATGQAAQANGKAKSLRNAGSGARPVGRLHRGAAKELALAVIENESESIRALGERLNDAFFSACDTLLQCRSRIVVIGMGKSGHVASKIAATLASTGSPAFFVHPGEASHGDLGMITADDVVLALSNSGETDEITTIIPMLRRLQVPLVAMTGKPESTLAKAATFHIDVSVAQEACPLGLAPTSSTTAAIAMGDVVAITLLEARGFTAEDFARSHPAGALGRRLLVRIRDVMRTGDEIPRCTPGTALSDALVEMSGKGMGATGICSEDDTLLGVFTDGDLRRTLDARVDLDTPIDQVMTRNGKSVSPDDLAVDAASLMETHKIQALFAVNEKRQVQGVLNFHDLMRAGVI